MNPRLINMVGTLVVWAVLIVAYFYFEKRKNKRMEKIEKRINTIEEHFFKYLEKLDKINRKLVNKKHNRG